MPISPFQLVVSDLDGTLLDSTSRISSGTLDAIRAVREQGVRFTIATGRGFLISLPLARRLKIDQPIIISGGALIVEPPSGKIIDQQPMPMEDIGPLVAFAREADLGISFHEPNRVIAEASDTVWEQTTQRNWLPEETEHILAFWRVPDLLAACACPPVRVDFFGPRERVLETAQVLRESFPGLQVLPIFAHVEITRAGVNKGSALVRLAGLLDIPLQQVLAIGDDLNDASMFQAAGFSVASGNAVPEMKAMAGAIAPTNDKGAVAWALRHYVLNEDGR